MELAIFVTTQEVSIGFVSHENGLRTLINLTCFHYLILSSLACLVLAWVLSLTLKEYLSYLASRFPIINPWIIV